MTDTEKTLRALDLSRANHKPHLYRKTISGEPVRWWVSGEAADERTMQSWVWTVRRDAA